MSAERVVPPVSADAAGHACAPHGGAQRRHIEAYASAAQQGISAPSGHTPNGCRMDGGNAFRLIITKKPIWRLRAPPRVCYTPDWWLATGVAAMVNEKSLASVTTPRGWHKHERGARHEKYSTWHRRAQARPNHKRRVGLCHQGSKRRGVHGEESAHAARGRH